MLQNQLIQLGFSSNEALVFQTIYQLGPSLASTLARITKIKRTSIYDHLNKLESRNLIYSYKQGKFSYYAIDDIQKIYHEEKEKLTLAEKIVRDLKNSQYKLPITQIYYYRGQEGYRELYEDILNSNTKEICAWINLDTFYKFIDPQREIEWTKERIRQGIKSRLILLKSPLSTKFRKTDLISLRETRLIEKESFESTCIIYSNYTVYFDPNEQNPSGIRIHNAQIAQLQKMIFQQNWNYLDDK